MDSRGLTAASDERSAVLAARAAAVIHILIGLGFGGGALWTVLHLVQNGELPMTPWGFRSMAGPFERLGTEAFVALGVALAVVCAVDIAAGVWLWRLQCRGFRLGLVTALPQIALGLGFALPFQLVSVPLRVVLGLAARRSLR
jgi:hypothetical protein